MGGMTVKFTEESRMATVQANTAAIVDISLNTIISTLQIPEGTVCCPHVLTDC